VLNRALQKYHIVIREGYGWKTYKNNGINVWFCGYQYNSNIEDMLSKISSILFDPTVSSNDILNWINDISGHFAIIVETSTWVVASVDKICSIPLFFSNNNGIFISNHAPLLKKKCKLGEVDLDDDARLEIAMSGYTIAGKTLYSGLECLESGWCILLNNGYYCKENYYTYSPWIIKYRNKHLLKKDLTNVFINTFSDLKNSANGRQIVIPLSAGNDSRLIVSALKKIGCENVICVSYGRKGNFETPISKSIAEKLGCKWIHLQINIRDKHNFFKSNVYRRYVESFESYSYIPNVQEIYEVSLLKDNHLIDDNAIIVNGNSGDFISGGHIRSISDTANTIQAADKIKWNKFLDKHYSLWGDLKGDGNDFYIISALEKVLSHTIELEDCDMYQYSIMEYFEYIGRQSRIVMGQQRTYEYFGYEWRLPLWSNDMLYFWEGVPYKYKVDQRLYVETLCDNNWGNVWLDIKVNDKVINPLILRWLRILLKTLFIPLGKSSWHRFEKNVLEYFMHPSYALSPVSYFRILSDFRGYRNIASWLSDKMLESVNAKRNNQQ